MTRNVRKIQASDPGAARPEIRSAMLGDLPQLVELEQRCFDADRITRRSFHWMLTRARASLQVATIGEVIAGYVLVLFHGRTALARIYSIAVDPAHRGAGIARTLLATADQQARLRGCAYIRLEVRGDNQPAIRLYEREGYRQFGIHDDYYEDHSPALRYQKRLRLPEGRDGTRVPYYPQTTEFTCGPASLMMAMKALDPNFEIDRRLELQLWREATTIFMTSGHGGCSPHGLALAAHRRAFPVELYLNSAEVPFVESVRSLAKREVIELVHADFAAQLEIAGVPVHHNTLPLPELEARLEAGAVPLVMISTYRINRNKAPHWVLITAHDARFVYVHDPEIDPEEHRDPIDCIHVPIEKREFDRMARFGRSQLRAMVIVYPRP